MQAVDGGLHLERLVDLTPSRAVRRAPVCGASIIYVPVFRRGSLEGLPLHARDLSVSDRKTTTRLD